MTRRDLSDEQIKADILNHLLNVGAFGAYHIPIDKMRSWIQNKIKRDGRTVTRFIEELGRAGLIARTSRNTIYAVHSRLDEIIEYTEKYLG